MAKGFTDAQLDAMDEMEARQNLYGTAARVLEPPEAAPMTDAQMDQRVTSDSVMQATSFGQKTMPQPEPQPPQADFRAPARPLTDAELNAQEDALYYDPSYEMPFEEFAPVHARRQEQKNTVGSFVDGAVAAGQGLVSLTAEMGGELRDNFTSNLFRPDRFATQNFVTFKEGGRKAGLEFAKFVDWIGNTARDHATDVRRQEQVRGVIAQKLQAEGKLSGDLRKDIEIINREFAAAKERGETAPTPLEENADVEQAFEDYRRGKNFDREIAGVGNYRIGQTPVTQESSEARATNPFTGEVMAPQRALATGLSLAMAPDNILPVGAGVLAKARVLRRLSSITGVPLKMTEGVANAGADALQRGSMRITDKVQDLTGMNAGQQTAAATALTATAGYLSAQGQGAPAAIGGVATGVLSILPIMKFGGAILRRTGGAAGGGYAIVREMGAGGVGVAGAETAEAMAKSGVFPQRYARYMQPGAGSVESTLQRVAKSPENPQMLRRLSRTADNLGATQVFRLTDDIVSSAAVSGLAAAPFALTAPDAEQGGQIVGGAVLLGTVAGTATRAFGRRPAEVDADIARMLVDVTESNGDAASLMSLSHDSLSQLAAMQGVLRDKVKFIPLRGQDYRANADLRAAGGETAAGLYVEKDANGLARIFVNMGHTAPVDGTVVVRPDADRGGSVIDITAADGTVDSTHVPQGVRLLVKTGDTVSSNQRLAQDLSPNRIIPHEIGHAILTSNILDGQPRNDLRNLVNQQYAPEGVAARGREYATQLVDKDILVGAIEDAPVKLTDAQIDAVSTGKTTLADIMKSQPVSEQARQRLIDQRVEELSQRSIERGEDALDWARDEIIAETFASEAPAIDFRAIRRDAAFPRLAESVLATGGRVLEMMGVRLDGGTGKMLDNPSVLFRDNPLFQDRIMQKRVKEYVRAYDQFLVGLEEAGSATPRGVELARSSRPEDLANSTHVKLRDEGRGVLENDFLFQKPDGTYSFKPQRIINAAEANRAAQIKTLYDARKFVPVNSTEFGKRKVNGREVIGGPVLPPQFDLFTQFPKHVREFARAMEASRAEGGSWNIDYNAIGTGSSGRYRITNMGAVRAIQRETVPFGWQVTKQNHLLAASLDLNAFRASAMKAINRGELGIFNNDMRQVEADLKTYLANHRNGLPGEATIGQQKRDTLNGLIGTGTAVQRAANPLYAELNPKGSIRTWRIDRLNDAQPSGRTGYFFDYDKINNNRMPQQIPREAQGMPDVAPQDAFEYAKRNHGTTRSIYEAGYVLPDGTMLDFSGKNDAGGYERKPDGNFGPQSGQRDYLRDTRNSDHREIRFSESQDFGGGEAMTEFMRRGAVRVDANSGLISIHGRQRLTSAQKSVIKDIVRSKDSAWLDLEDDAGNRTSLELKSGKWAPVEGLLNQWADGKTPQPRAQFMPDAATYLDREYNPAELAARAKREGYELVYHGDRNQPASDKYRPWTRAKMPLFTSFDAAAADWFGDPRPLFVKASKIASYDDMISAARRSGVKGTYGERGEPANIPEVRKHSTYEGYNENDLLYIPQVREELRKQGFDAVRVFDQLERDEIDALIVIGSPDQVVDPLKTQRRGQAMPDVVHGDNTPLPPQVPDRGFYIIGTKPTADGRKLEYHLDPATTIQPRVAGIESIRGERVAMLEADRHNTRGDNMGGPLHPFLISNQTVARLPDGRGYKAVWANMNSAFVTRAKNIVKETTAGHALIQIMKENAHRSNRKFVMDVTSEIDARRPNMTADQSDFLHVVLELGAINPQGQINRAYSRVERTSKAVLQKEATMSELAAAQRDYDAVFKKYQPMVKFLDRLSPLKSHATRKRMKEFDGEFASLVSKHRSEPWYSGMAAKYRNTKFVDEAARFSFKQRGAAMDRITGIPFAPDVKAMLKNSMDFVNGQNLDVVGVVQLSKDVDTFAVYFGKNAKEEAKMSANERMLRDQFLASGTFKPHPSYDWVMLGPENADSFILDAPADPLKLFPDYAKNHPNPKVKKGSKETVVGTMKKSKIPLVIK